MASNDLQVRAFALELTEQIGNSSKVTCEGIGSNVMGLHPWAKPNLASHVSPLLTEVVIFRQVTV
jgi:hypothetical protein